MTLKYNEPWDELDKEAWRAWARDSWLPGNITGLQGEPLGEAREGEGEKQVEEESWRKSKVPQRKAWI